MTAETFSKDDDDKFIQFIWCSIIFVVVRWTIGYIITDVPKKYKYVLKRHEHIADKFLVGMPEASKDDEIFDEKTKLAVHTAHPKKYIYDKDWNVSDDQGEDSFDSQKLKDHKQSYGGSNSPVKTKEIILVDKDKIGASKNRYENVILAKSDDEYDVSNDEDESGSEGEDDYEEDSYFSEDEEENSEEEYR